MVKMYQLHLLGLVTREIPVLLVPQAQQGPLAPQGRLVQLGRLAPPGLMVAMGLTVAQDQPGLLVLRDQLAQQVRRLASVAPVPLQDP